MSKKFISPNRGTVDGGSEPYRLFALSMIEWATTTIDEYVHRKTPFGLNHATQKRRQNPALFRSQCLEIATDAYLWIFSDRPNTRGLTFQDVCDGIGMDAEFMRSGIRERFAKFRRFQHLANLCEGRIRTKQGRRQLVAS